ncbi:MAG TPA: excinuclease ATPase subunit [Gammaproteobacteria bacterium]|nr:excinuclease ATPase subunit [Gammaproteobacteria bacterium]
MKRIGLLIMVSIITCAASPVFARDTKHMFPIKEGMNTPAAKEKLNQGIKLYFGGQKHPKVEKSFGEFTSNKKTNALNKDDHEACDWSLLSALLSLQERAVNEGGNAVINIRSYYKKNEAGGAGEYECHAGAVMAGVTLRGEVVKLAK